MKKKILSVLLTTALVVGLTVPAANAGAASKQIKLSAKKLTLTVGEKKTLTVKKGSKKVKGVKWKSSNKKVATVSAGKVTAKKAGKATITATVSKKKYTCAVTVKAKTDTTAGTETPTGTTAATATVAPTAIASAAPTGTKTPSGTPVASATASQSTEGTSASPQTAGTVTPPIEDATTAPADTDSTTAPADTETTTAPADMDATPAPSEAASEAVTWTAQSEKFEGAFSQTNEETGVDEVYPITLTRKYVSFSPWPTTNEQVQYVIQNCDDPYVIAALYVVALDNYEYKGRSDYTGVTYQMLDSLVNGAGAVSASTYSLTNLEKQRLAEFGTKYCGEGAERILTSEFASRAFLKGATPENGYTPEGGLEDKTKWQIIVDQYPYCFDQEAKSLEEMKYLTLCLVKYTLFQEAETDEPSLMEHYQGIRIGYRWNSTKKVWLPTDNINLNTDPGNSALKKFNITGTVLFSNEYIAPKVDQGF